MIATLFDNTPDENGAFFRDGLIAVNLGKYGGGGEPVEVLL